MPRRRKTSDSSPFDTLRLEGGLFVAELLERAARGGAPGQDEADYGVPKGLKLHDEYGRSYRIATALWKDFAARMPREDAEPHRTTLHFVRDLLRDTLGYTDLDLPEAPVALGDRAYPIPAFSPGGRMPVVVAPHDLGLDEPDARFAIQGSGARRKSPHQLAQEFLNASPDSTWAIVTNGKTLRLLRDAETLTRPNFLEFDIETILREGEDRYADFSALWRILHASRSRGTPCLWEKWKTEGQAQGLRVREGLRDGVQAALIALGTGFVAHPANVALRERLQDGSLGVNDYFQQLLRLIYRLLFLFCAEERELLHPPGTSASARQSYASGYGLRRLRRRSLRQSALDLHGDLWISTRIVFRSLASGQEKLALPALGGLFAPSQCPDLDSASLSNRDFLSAMRDLRWFFDKKTSKRSAIDFRNMGTEELGSVYESLLELVPRIDLPARTFGFVGITTEGSTSGNARKTTGSFYTPDSLVQELIKSALDPVIEARLKENPERPIDALLSITVCDPSCGSGHFLLAAARRLAEKLAELRAPDGAVRPDDYRHALRDVASRCLYGVDINPMAVELCRVALWLETVDPGKPLGFLDHHIRTGNSLLGTTPELIAAGLPDDTFTAIEGDDKAACTELKKLNKKEREGFGPLFEKEEQTIRDRLRQAATAVEEMDESDLAHRNQKEAEFRKAQTTDDYRHAKFLADLWCAAFVIKKHYPGGSAESEISNPKSKITPLEDQLLHTQEELFGQTSTALAPKAARKTKLRTTNQEQGAASGITTGTLRNFVQGQALPEALEKEVTQLASQYRFFHWHIAFPQVFEKKGFDCILGNPPWEHTELKEKEWFAERSPQIADASTGAKRKALINKLAEDNPPLWLEYIKALRQHDGSSHFLGNSGHYPFCGRGRINHFAVFAEQMRRSLNSIGQMGAILPTGIATDDTTKFFFQDIVTKRALVSLFDFANSEELFKGVDRNAKFCLLTLNQGTGRKHEVASIAFGATKIQDLTLPDKRFNLKPEDIALLNPNTLTCPVFRSVRDAELNQAIYQRIPVLMLDSASNGNPWGVSFSQGLFNTTTDSKLFRSIETLKESSVPVQGNKFKFQSELYYPVYEGKMIQAFDHRYANSLAPEAGAKIRGKSEHLEIDAKRDPEEVVFSRHYVRENDCLNNLPATWTHKWFLGWRAVGGAVANVRTLVCSIVPFGGVADKIFLMYPSAEAVSSTLLLCSMNSFVVDYCVRQKISGITLNYFIIKQLPVLLPATFAQPCPWACQPDITPLRDWLLPRVLELTYTAWDLEPFAG